MTNTENDPPLDAPPSEDAQAPAEAEHAEQSQGPAGPKVVQKVDRKQLQHFVTEIKTAEQQVGENIIRALRHDGTVAVITTVVVGPDGQQQVISAALDPKMIGQVQYALAQAQVEREPEEPCVGFHCLVKPKREAEGDDAAPSSS